MTLDFEAALPALLVMLASLVSILMIDSWWKRRQRRKKAQSDKHVQD